MGDFKTTSYQADYLKKFATDREQEQSIYYQIPDQFSEYESKSYNPFYFFTNSGEFNLNEINKSYRLEQIKRMKFYKELEEKRLREMHRLNPPIINLGDMTMDQHLNNFQNTFFSIVKDLETEPKISTKILTKDHRLFYVGILFLIIFMLYLILEQLNTFHTD